MSTSWKDYLKCITIDFLMQIVNLMGYSWCVLRKRYIIGDHERLFQISDPSSRRIEELLMLLNESESDSSSGYHECVCTLTHTKGFNDASGGWTVNVCVGGGVSLSGD